MTGAGVAAVAGGRPGASLQRIAAGLAIAVAGVALVAWVVRLGFLAAMLSRPVLDGYMAGIAVLMIGSQLGRASRLDIPTGRPDQEVAYWLGNLDRAHPATLALSAAVLVGLFAAQRWRPACPGP